MNEIQIAQKTCKVPKVEDDLFGTSSSIGHCVFSDFFMGAVVARQFSQLYPKVKTKASREQTP